MQPEETSSILEMSESWDTYQRQQMLWREAGLSLPDKLCILLNSGAARALRSLEDHEWISGGNH